MAILSERKRQKYKNMKRMILAGGSGFLGQALARHFRRPGWELVCLSRQPAGGASLPGFRELFWDGLTLGGWVSELNGATALINLAGRSVDCRYHARNRREIMDSRVNPTRLLGQAIRQCSAPPPVWLNASTATIYRHSLDRPMDESGDIGATPAARDEFSVSVAQAWEQAFFELPNPFTRRVALRTAMVLGSARNSVLPVLLRLARWGLGGTMGSGKQYVSWIHERDFCRAIEWIISHEKLVGPVNLAAPQPLPNREMMRELRAAVGAPFGLPATDWMLEIGAFFLRTETELILKSRRVVPGRLLADGFAFDFSTFAEAVADLNRGRIS